MRKIVILMCLTLVLGCSKNSQNITIDKNPIDIGNISINLANAFAYATNINGKKKKIEGDDFFRTYLLIQRIIDPKFNRETDFNFDWKFSLRKDTLKPAVVPLNDTNWRDVRLPHDWSVEMDFDSIYEGATGYLPGGVGVYQKHFKTPTDPSKKNTYILFDGVYNNATFWLNGKRLGENPYGYSPVYFNITDILKTNSEENVLTVHVDHSRYADSRWYTGSGIYRNVKLITLNKPEVFSYYGILSGGTYTPEDLEKAIKLLTFPLHVLNHGRSTCQFCK